MTPEELEAIVRRVVTEVVDAAFAARFPTEPKAKKSRAGLLTLAEAGELVRTPVATLRMWIWQGRIQAFKPGKHPLLRESDLLELVEQSETVGKRARARLTKATKP